MGLSDHDSLLLNSSTFVLKIADLEIPSVYAELTIDVNVVHRCAISRLEPDFTWEST